MSSTSSPSHLTYDDHIAFLKQLGADASGHVKDSLLHHLEGTYALLKQWNDPEPLRLAGLYHAVYTTHGYSHALMDVSDREPLRQRIGDEAENLVYYFCACEREPFYEQIGRVENPEFHNRFTGQTTTLEPKLLRDLLELTLANELQIILAPHDEPELPLARRLRRQAGSLLRSVTGRTQQHPAAAMFGDLFRRSEPYISEAAKRSYREALGRK